MKGDPAGMIESVDADLDQDQEVVLKVETDTGTVAGLLKNSPHFACQSSITVMGAWLDSITLYSRSFCFNKSNLSLCQISKLVGRMYLLSCFKMLQFDFNCHTCIILVQFL